MTTNGPRVPNEALLEAGLKLMEQNGKPLHRIDGPSRAMLYGLPNGQRVRVRTSNDHILVILADRPTPEDAKLNIEGTDYVLIVMPEKERALGKVIAYLVPTDVAAKEAKAEHSAWLKSKPNTKGNNLTWNLWFYGEGFSSGFDHKWKQYRLQGESSTLDITPSFTPAPTPITLPSSPANSGIKAVVEAARQHIAAVAGVSPSAVRITVDFGA